MSVTASLRAVSLEFRQFRSVTAMVAVTDDEWPNPGSALRL